MKAETFHCPFTALSQDCTMCAQWGERAVTEGAATGHFDWWLLSQLSWMGSSRQFDLFPRLYKTPTLFAFGMWRKCEEILQKSVPVKTKSLTSPLNWSSNKVLNEHCSFFTEPKTIYFFLLILHLKLFFTIFSCHFCHVKSIFLHLLELFTLFYWI